MSQTASSLPPVVVDDEVAALLDDDGLDRIEFLGRRFLLAPKIGAMPILRFGHLAKNGASVDDLEAFGVVYDVIFEAIDDSERDAFAQYATEQHADMDDLLMLVHKSIEVMGARPTRRPSDSSDGPSITETNSSDVSSYEESLTPLMRQRLDNARHLRPVG